MGRIYFILGKSASGKDSIYRILKEDPALALQSVVPYTTRPRRSGETEGVDYHYVTAEQMEKFRDEGRLIEIRTYQTVHGPWSYATVDDGAWDLNGHSYLMVGVLESYHSVRQYFGVEKVVPFYIHVEDGERLSRALSRERSQQDPKFEEMCRRFLADQQDFAPEKLEAEGIVRFYENGDLDTCVEEIRREILADR